MYAIILDELPDGCNSCPVKIGVVGGYCPIRRAGVPFDDAAARRPDCPIVELHCGRESSNGRA